MKCPPKPPEPDTHDRRHDADDDLGLGELTDPSLMEEIPLLAALVLAATASPGRLSPAAIDEVLGVGVSMFVDEDTRIAVPVAVALERLLAYLQGDGLQTASLDAFSMGQALLVRAGFAGLSKQVAVQNLPAYSRGDTIVIPIRWVATGPVADLFPPLDANLELDPAGGGTSRLTLRGSYRPPLGRVGASLDQMVLHQAARTTVSGFLKLVSRAILTPHTAPASEGALTGLQAPVQALATMVTEAAAW